MIRRNIQARTEKPRLFHAPSSYYSMIARLALAEGGVDYKPVFVDIHVRMTQQSPDYARLNPNMSVPTLVMPGRNLDESRLIAEFAFGLADVDLDAVTQYWLDLHYGVWGAMERKTYVRSGSWASALCAAELRGGRSSPRATA